MAVAVTGPHPCIDSLVHKLLQPQAGFDVDFFYTAVSLQAWLEDPA